MLFTSNTLSYTMQEFTNKLLKPHGVSFFSFGRIYKTGELWLINNLPKVNDIIHQHRLKPITDFPEEIISQQFFYKIPVNGPYAEALHIAEQLDVTHPFDCIELFDDYAQFSCFAVSKNISEANNFYYNKIPLLQTVIKIFQHQHKSLISHMDSKKYRH